MSYHNLFIIPRQLANDIKVMTSFRASFLTSEGTKKKAKSDMASNERNVER